MVSGIKKALVFWEILPVTPLSLDKAGAGWLILNDFASNFQDQYLVWSVITRLDEAAKPFPENASINVDEKTHDIKLQDVAISLII